MMESKHTPGPWRTLGCNLWGAKSQLVTRWGTFRFSDGSKAPPIAPMEADARLIAAAPELLEAAKAALDRLTDPYLGEDDGQRQQPEVEKLQAAIAKAEQG